MKKVIIITGSSSGIGLSLAEHFARTGFTVYGLSRRAGTSALFTTIPTDITHEQQVLAAVEQITAKENRVDVLINNAGMGIVGAVEDTTREDILKVFQLNLVSAVQVMNAVLPVMRRQKAGQIINISSIGSEMGLPYRGFYSASKAALDKVTEAVRYEVAGWNIEICALHLGDIRTNIAESRVRTKVSEPYRPTFEKVYALMNAHVNSGTPAQDVAVYIAALLHKKNWKAHYYFGKTGQKIGVPLKWILPQRVYERLMRRYNQM